jgi:succinate dehydrogenase iron-sulfur subunit
MMTLLEIPLRIFRCKAGETPHYDTFAVQVADTAHVLDAIDIAWAVYDHSLTFRRACHHASCGACALRINGVEKLPCITRITDVWDGHSPLCLDPLRNFPLVSDLVVDVSGFFQRMLASDMTITRTAELLLPVSVDDIESAVHVEPIPPTDEQPQFNRFENCIECGICMSACPTMAADDRFLGPAGLAAIYRACQQTDDSHEEAHLLALADGEHGVWRCHSAFECTEICPQAVDPAGKIMALRRTLIERRLKRRERK